MTKTATGFKPTYSSNIEDEAADSILKQKLSPAVVRELLEIIPVDELTKLGIDPLTWDPEQLVMKNVLVPPPIVRPSVTNEWMPTYWILDQIQIQNLPQLRSPDQSLLPHHRHALLLV